MLTDTQIKKAKPAEKPFKLSDAGGLHLYVTPAGGKLWRLKYRFGGKEKLLSIGPYPAVSLLDARTARDDAKSVLRQGKDPGVAKKLQRLVVTKASADTFEIVAREWFELNKVKWVDHHAGDVIRSLEVDVFPHVGHIPIREIKAPEVLAVLRLIEKRPAVDTARRVRQRMSAVFVYAISSGRADSDPAAVVLGAMAPVKKGRQPAVIDLAEAREIVRRVEEEVAHPATKLAHRLLALTALRPGAIVSTPWVELNAIEDGIWIVPSTRMKLRKAQKEDGDRDHLVPMSRQAMEVVEALRSLTGRGPLAFPNTRHAHLPMSENAIGYLLNRAGYHHRHVPHGWRSTFSSVMNERFRGDGDVIELMLAHVNRDRVAGAYNRALHLERRRELAQLWADIILEGRPLAVDLLKGPRK
ncbi:tyrosine-type recombinase/integrase [Ferirhizobium litorale]|uniref:Integrase arm-type DNA-binding domain-containing protein n=1 Tax=Ferirhizobium litorale TaxID=2927786 RepID=A0AAE3U2D6_9HYPH|nr:integrase arm-type DNA-binding domain-containing protein [Fererhizobium litorale]MDI7923381.1 integrase arm-type DNA-binding domain-containing protein [Fererhizobium litorale]